MRAAVYAYSARGCRLALQVAGCLRELGFEAVTVRAAAKYAAAFPVESLGSQAQPVYAADFRSQDALLFVGACGIALRCIAPYVASKAEDPAVLVLDEQANFLIPILSGHIGGANQLARCLAPRLGAQACVTTATDVNGLFAVDEWAARNRLVITSLSAAKAVSAALVAGEEVGVASAFPICSPLPRQLTKAQGGQVGFTVALNQLAQPFATTLHLLPKIVHLGIGCRRGTTREKIETLVSKALAALAIDPLTLQGAASIDVKQEEEGLLAFAEGWRLPLAFYSREELQAVAGSFTPSAFVAQTVGVDNVCERAAVLASGGGQLLLPKTSLPELGVTLAIAIEDFSLDFSQTGLKT